MKQVLLADEYHANLNKSIPFYVDIYERVLMLF